MSTPADGGGFRNRAYTDDDITATPDIVIHLADDEKNVKFSKDGHSGKPNENGLLHPEDGTSPPGAENEDEDDDTPNSEENTGSQKKRGKRKFEKFVSIRELFGHADQLDIIYMIIGTIGAFIHGLTLPGQLVIFGQLINQFVDFQKQLDILKDNATAIAEDDKINIEDEMLFYAQIYAYAAIGSWFVGYLQCAFWSISAIRQTHRIRLKFLSAILTQDIGWFDVNEAGGLTTRMFEDLTQIQTGIGDKVGTTIQAVSTLVGGFVIAFVLGWKLALVLLAVVPFIVLAGGLTGRVMAALTSKEQRAYAEAGAIAEEAISAIRTVVAFGGEKDELSRYNEKLVIAEKAGIKKAITGGISMSIFFMVMAASQALAFWYGSTLVADDDFPPGNLLTVFFCILIGSAQIGQAGPNMEALATARGAAYFVYDVIKRKSPIDTMSDEGKKPDFSSAEEITLQNVKFNYPSRVDVQVLKAFNLKIKKGSTVALVGESGCGKSTIVKLIQRFYDVTDGNLLIGNDDIRDINVSWLRKHIGIVSQEPVLFDLSIADNIRMGKENATQKEIENAAINANAHDFIDQLPQKYETNVGEGGAQLSGGQKQRIAIARALIKDPQILLLDEATSALDTESESIVQTALDNASMGRTTIIIAHRLSTVRNADCIVAVRDGKVAETGTHDELMALKGVYYQLVMLQNLAEMEKNELSETGSLITEHEREALLEVRLMRSLSQISHESGTDRTEEIEYLERALSIRKSKSNLKKEIKKFKKKQKKEDLVEEKVDPAPLSRILTYNKPEWPLMGGGVFFAAMHGCVPIFFAFIIGQILGSLALPKEELKEESKKWSLVFLAMGGANALGYFGSAYLFGKSGERLTRRLRSKAFECILKQDIGYFDDPYHGTGQLTARLANDATKVKGATSSRISILVQVSFTALSALGVAFYYSWELTLLVIAFVPFLVFGGIMRANRFKNFAAKEGKKLFEASAISQQALMNIRTVASLGKEQYFVDKFTQLVQESYPSSKFEAQLYGISLGSARGITFFANAAAFALGGHLVQEGEIKFQNIFKIIIAATFGSMIAGQALSFTPDFLSAKVAAGRLFKLFDTESKIDVNQPGGKIKEGLNGDVDFSDVMFNYPTRPDVPVLQGLSFGIKSGQKVALVGASGCGKSTAISLLERFYDPKKGEIQIDGEVIGDYNLKWLRSQISIVSQEPVLFAKTIKDNIIYGMVTDGESVSQKLIEESAKAANIHDFIIDLPRGYDTMVGEKGTLISGGQKQRIAIARALIRNPKLLLLDEATSALDSESEKIVQDALDRAMDNRTSIIIAHRLSTVQNADVIVVVQGGQVIEMGSHHELLANRGAYYILNTAQL